MSLPSRPEPDGSQPRPASSNPRPYLLAGLLVVVTCGLILMRTNLLMNVLILASAVLLARLDLARIGVVPPPLLTIIGLGSWVLLGLWLGHRLPSPLLFALG